MADRGAVRKDEAIQLAMELRGMLDAPQIEYLYDLAQMAPDGAACEVGVWRGRSFAGWALGRIGRGPLIAVDWWYGGKDVAELQEAEESPGDTAAEIGAKRRRYFMREMKRLGLLMHTRVVDSLSWEAPLVLRMPLAFCFIDACHDYEAIKRDVGVWPSYMVRGGIIAFHDYGTVKCPGIRQAVEEWQGVKAWERLGIVGSTIAFRRPGRE